MADDERNTLEPIESEPLSPRISTDPSTARPPTEPVASTSEPRSTQWPKARAGTGFSTSSSGPKPFPDFVDEPQSYDDRDR